MAGYLPATGSQISFGRVYRGYVSGSYPPPGGTNIRLNGTLGVSYGGKGAGVSTSFSATFGGKYYPYTY
jgi:hypothetical protein